MDSDLTMTDYKSLVQTTTVVRGLRESDVHFKDISVHATKNICSFSEATNKLLGMVLLQLTYFD